VEFLKYRETLDERQGNDRLESFLIKRPELYSELDVHSIITNEESKQPFQVMSKVENLGPEPSIVFRGGRHGRGGRGGRHGRGGMGDKFGRGIVNPSMPEMRL
jgi:hypothetical protein